MALVRRAIEDIRAGKMVILVDDEDRENEGDLMMAADLVTPEAINFMARYGRGLICLSLSEDRVRQLGLTMMATDNRSPRATAFTVSIDARRGMTTGISARERAETIRAAVARDAVPDDLVTPGHIFPLKARRGGVLVRSGHTEGSVDLARLAGRELAGVICEIMRDDGEMARMPDLEKFAAEHNLLIVTIADLIEYRMSQELLVRRAGEARFGPHIAGLSREFQAYVYVTDVEDTEYLALVLGEPSPDEPVLVRVQTASVMRDVFGVSADPDVLARHRAAADDRGGGQGHPALRAAARPREPGRRLPRVAGQAAAGGRRRARARTTACATSAWARRCWRTSACTRSACSPTTRAASSASRATACTSSNASLSAPP